MLFNYLHIAHRNIKKDRLSSVINITGLTVGIACFLILYLFIKDELSYDSYNKDAGQIYRVCIRLNINHRESVNAKVEAPLGAQLVNDCPEVISSLRLGHFGERIFRYKDKTIKQGSIFYVDSSFFDFFPLTFISGNSKTALNHPNSLVLTESAAKKYFGDENPTGQIIHADQMGDYLITAVVKDFPVNSHFSCEFLASINTYPLDNMQDWVDLSFSTYIKVRPHTDIRQLDKKLEQIVSRFVIPAFKQSFRTSNDKFFETGNSIKFILQPYSSIYLRSHSDYNVDPNSEWWCFRLGDITYIYIFSAVAVFLLLIAVINFMNLSTARSERRAKEVGVRKTLGANKINLIYQFITESVLLSFLSVAFSIAIVEMLLPFFNKLVEKDLKLQLFSDFYSLPSLIGFVLFVGILSGSYPAFYLSSFQPAQILKSGTVKKRRKNALRNYLVVIQFAISIILLISTLVIKDQLDYLMNKNLGFSKEQLIQIYNGRLLGNKAEAFKEELLKNPRISNVSSSTEMFAVIPGNGYSLERSAGSNVLAMQYLETDYSFLDTYKMKMAEGRFFSNDYSTDTSAIIVNEATLRELNIKDVIGRDIYPLRVGQMPKPYKIIGVIKDFHFESLHLKIRPLELHLLPHGQSGQVFTVRLLSDNMNSTIDFIKATWNKFVSEESFNYDFLNKNFSNLYKAEEKTRFITGIFSFLTIFIACMGLFGLAAFITEQRTKEIGIRKVLGASVLEIVILLTKEFTKWVIIANLLAWPLAYLVLQKWLGNFAYRTEINFSLFIISGLSALLISLLTVGFHAVKTAITNPVQSLKYE